LISIAPPPFCSSIKQEFRHMPPARDDFDLIVARRVFGSAGEWFDLWSRLTNQFSSGIWIDDERREFPDNFVQRGRGNFSLELNSVNLPIDAANVIGQDDAESPVFGDMFDLKGVAFDLSSSTSSRRCGRIGRHLRPASVTNAVARLSR
jgi:hypothetical protein